jgi:hypothetical protein
MKLGMLKDDTPLMTNRKRRLKIKELMRGTKLRDLEELIDDQPLPEEEEEGEDQYLKNIIRLMAPSRGHPHALAKLFGGICRDHGTIHKP